MLFVFVATAHVRVAILCHLVGVSEGILDIKNSDYNNRTTTIFIYI